MNKININWFNTLKDYLPTIWVTKEFKNNDNFQWLTTLLKPLRCLFNKVFVPYRDNSFYDLNHTGQVLAMEHYINTYYGLSFSTTSQNAIYFENIVTNDETYLFQNSEQAGILSNERVFIYQDNENIPLYLFQNSELTIYSNFIVNAPTYFQASQYNFENTVNSILKKYIPSGFEATYNYY